MIDDNRLIMNSYNFFQNLITKLVLLLSGTFQKKEEHMYSKYLIVSSLLITMIIFPYFDAKAASLYRCESATACTFTKMPNVTLSQISKDLEIFHPNYVKNGICGPFAMTMLLDGLTQEKGSDNVSYSSFVNNKSWVKGITNTSSVPNKIYRTGNALGYTSRVYSGWYGTIVYIYNLVFNAFASSFDNNVAATISDESNNWKNTNNVKNIMTKNVYKTGMTLNLSFLQFTGQAVFNTKLNLYKAKMKTHHGHWQALRGYSQDKVIMQDGNLGQIRQPIRTIGPKTITTRDIKEKGKWITQKMEITQTPGNKNYTSIMNVPQWQGHYVINHIKSIGFAKKSTSSFLPYFRFEGGP